MSILDSVGGLSGGLGGSGGVGGSIPSNTATSTAAATNTIDPSIAVGGTGQGAYFNLGPFNPVFPGAYSQPLDAVNRAPLLSALIPKGAIGLALVGLAFAFIIFLAVRK